jgi:hypothetical protein
MRRWRDGLYSEFGKLDASITPEEAVAAAAFINSFVLLLAFARIPSSAHVWSQPVGRMLHFKGRPR